MTSAAPPTPVATTRPTVGSASPASGAAPVDAAAATPPRFTSREDIDAALADADRAVRAAATPRTPRTDTAAGPARPARAAGPAAAEITRDTTVDDAARRLAADLRTVPGIERFGSVRLAELERSGPRPLRTMWRIAREQLDARYGQLTIGELIDRYGSDRRST